MSKSRLVKKELENSLQERVKELTCLYGIAKLIEQQGNSVNQIFQGTVNLIPRAWQYPEITSSRITFEDQFYHSAEFKESRWVQAAPIMLDGIETGCVEVFYLEEKPESDEGPFLQEERTLINAIAERLGRACERIRTTEHLQRKQQDLHHLNIALHEVISKVQQEKDAINQRLSEKIDRLILPMIHDIENRLPTEERGYIAALKQTLQEITTPFSRRYEKALVKLTPVEIQLCNLIGNGMMSKEIARLRNISPATVARHREKIRKKLGITHKQINLTSYLRSVMNDS